MLPLWSMTWKGKARLGKKIEDFQSVVEIISFRLNYNVNGITLEVSTLTLGNS